MYAYIQIGSIVATTGLKGTLVLQHKLGAAIEDSRLSAWYIELNKGSYIPYFIDAIQKTGTDEVHCKLESIDTREAAKSLLKKKVYVDQATFSLLIPPESELYFTGFIIYDKKEKELGIVREMISLPEQNIAKVMEGERELLIPLTQETIEKIDHNQKIIHVHLPEGLLDIYRS